MTNENRMNFTAVIAFVDRPDVTEKLEQAEALTGHSQGGLGGCEVQFQSYWEIDNQSTYDAVMLHMKSFVVEQMIDCFDFDESDIVRISIRAEWEKWEKLTGLKHNQCAAESINAPYGHFIMRQLENLQS